MFFGFLAKAAFFRALKRAREGWQMWKRAGQRRRQGVERRVAILATGPSECRPPLLGRVGAEVGRLGALAARRSHVKRHRAVQILGQHARGPKARSLVSSGAVTWLPSSRRVLTAGVCQQTPPSPHHRRRFLSHWLMLFCRETSPVEAH